MPVCTHAMLRGQRGRLSKGRVADRMKGIRRLVKLKEGKKMEGKVFAFNGQD